MAKKIEINNTALDKHIYKTPERKRRPVVCHILIVCEGEKTERFYFEEFEKEQKGTYVYELKFDGGGINTMGVVDEAIKLKDMAEKDKMPYDSVWAVFDKDDFPDDKFNGAIIKAMNNGIGCAWSNEAFELWYLLHFNNMDTSMVRKQYQGVITKAVNKKWPDKKKYLYDKSDPDTPSIIKKYGCQDSAIKWAEDLEKKFNNGKYHTHNPCTTVYKLVRQLIGKDKKFNAMIKKKMGDHENVRCIPAE